MLNVQETIRTKIAGQQLIAIVKILSVDDAHIRMAVRNNIDALIVCHEYNKSFKTEIQKNVQNGQTEVVVFKN